MLHPEVLLVVDGQVVLTVDAQQVQPVRDDVLAGDRKHHVGPLLPVRTVPGMTIEFGADPTTRPPIR
jgi:hypothetical protein